MSVEAENEADAYALPDVAVIGMSGRFPGADGVEAFWRNLREGVESITFFTGAVRPTTVVAGATASTARVASRPCSAQMSRIIAATSG